MLSESSCSPSWYTRSPVSDPDNIERSDSPERLEEDRREDSFSDLEDLDWEDKVWRGIKILLASLLLELEGILTRAGCLGAAASPHVRSKEKEINAAESQERERSWV
jgi:hypothetical protein